MLLSVLSAVLFVLMFPLFLAGYVVTPLGPVPGRFERVRVVLGITLTSAGLLCFVAFMGLWGWRTIVGDPVVLAAACGPAAAVLDKPAGQFTAADAAVLHDAADTLATDAAATSDDDPGQVSLADAYKGLAVRIEGGYSARDLELAADEAHDAVRDHGCPTS